MAKAKTGGRQKGSTNVATKQIREILAAVMTPDVEAAKWRKYLNHKDDAIAFDCFKLAIAYKHGRPTQAVKLEDENGITFSLGSIAEQVLEKQDGSSGGGDRVH